MENPFSSVKNFTIYLHTLSCAGCTNFNGERCIHKNYIKHENTKKELIKIHKKIGQPFNLEWIENINERYICTDFNK